jgi:hypothetical protein
MKCPECRHTMMWTGDHDSDEGGELGLMVSWRCINEECEVRSTGHLGRCDFGTPAISYNASVGSSPAPKS